MFGETWRWAGKYRETERNLAAHFQIRELLVALLGDATYWVHHDTYSADEIAIRFHHRLVAIHPFPNGNGRHARLMADVMAIKMGRPIFSWGRGEIAARGDARRKYIDALRAADGGEIGLLLTFARS